MDGEARPGGGHHEGDARDQRSALLLELAEALHGAALPADLVEELVVDAARGLGLPAQIFTLQSFVALETGAGPARRVDIRRMAFDTHWNLRRMGRLVDLARTIAHGRVGVPEARAAIAEASALPSLYPRWLIVAAYAAYAAAVAARVGGAALEMVVAAAIGLTAGIIHFGTLRSTQVDLTKSFLAALCGSAVAVLATQLLPPFAVGPAIFGGVTLLVPAMVLTIALHELTSEALESGTVRLAYGLLRFLMLGFGVAMALTGARLLGVDAAVVPPRPIASALVLLGIVAAGGLALTVCLQGRPRDAPWIVLGATLAYAAQALTKHWLGGSGSPFLAAFVVGAAAHLYARLPGGFAATVMVPGLLQLAPGFLGTRAVFHLLEGRPVPGQDFFAVLLTGLQLGMGLLLAAILFRGRSARRVG